MHACMVPLTPPLPCTAGGAALTTHVAHACATRSTCTACMHSRDQPSMNRDPSPPSRMLLCQLTLMLRVARPMLSSAYSLAPESAQTGLDPSDLCKEVSTEQKAHTPHTTTENG